MNSRSGRERWLTNRNQHAYVSTHLGRAPVARAASHRGYWTAGLARACRVGSLPSEDGAGPRGTGSGFEYAEPRQRAAGRVRDLAPRARDSRSRHARARCLRALPRPALTLAQASREGRATRQRVIGTVSGIHWPGTRAVSGWCAPDRRARRLPLRSSRVGASRPLTHIELGLAPSRVSVVSTRGHAPTTLPPGESAYHKRAFRG